MLNIQSGETCFDVTIYIYCQEYTDECNCVVTWEWPYHHISSAEIIISTLNGWGLLRLPGGLTQRVMARCWNIPSQDLSPHATPPPGPRRALPVWRLAKADTSSTLNS